MVWIVLSGKTIPEPVRIELFTSRFAAGLVVPMPTLPAPVTLKSLESG